MGLTLIVNCFNFLILFYYLYESTSRISIHSFKKEKEKLNNFKSYTISLCKAWF